MENKKCCEHDHHGVHVCVHVDGCCTDGEPSEPCACVPNLSITIGEDGQFATLTEALEYASTVVHNSLIIKMLSDVTETRTNAIWVSGFGDETGLYTGVPAFALKGDGHTLNLNSITDTVAIGYFAGGKGWLEHVTVLAHNVTEAAIRVGSGAFTYIRKDFVVEGNPLKTTQGFKVYQGSHLQFALGNSIIRNFKYGIHASSSSIVTSGTNTLTFDNVTTNCFPAPNTIGNGNAYIHVG